MEQRVRRLSGRLYTTGMPVAVMVVDGVIREINELPATGEPLPWIGPGLVDLQINGYDGLDFNEFPIGAERVIEISRRLCREGVTSYFPTVTTNSVDKITEACSAIAQACREDADTAGSITGIHVEGPFLSPEDGPRGAHNREYIRPPEPELFARWQEAAEGRIRLLTLSPEWPGSASFIEGLTAEGVTVSIGHTAATPEQIREAVAAGARMSTHFGNGAHLMLPRHPNYLWEQLAQDELWSCLIGDGFHLPDAFIKVVLRTKGEKAMLVSDAVHLTGMPPGEYHSHKRVHVVKTPEGRLQLRDQPQLLAGSAQMLPWAIGKLTGKGLSSLAEAWDMASVRPARFMKLPVQQGLAVGAPADIVTFLHEGDEVRILQTFKHGQLLYSSGV